MGKVLCCPLCGSADLECEGTTSVLDGKKRKRCQGCGQLLAPRRSRLLLGGVFAIALMVTGFCLVFLVLGNVAWLPGLVVGPAVMVLSAAALFAQMPVYRSQ